MSNKLSLTFRFLRVLGFNYSEQEYGQISLGKVWMQFWGNMWRALLVKMMDWWVLEPINPRKMRPILLRLIGCNVGKDVFIGDHVRIDTGHAKLITIDERAHITSGCRLLCHQRNLFSYRIGDDASKLKYKLGKIHIGKGCMIGMESLIMPGVTIGEGAIVGAYSFVNKDIPAWTVAAGRPAKVVKKIPIRS